MNACDQMYQLLQSFEQAYNSMPQLQDELRGRHGWINAVIGIRTDDAAIAHGLIIEDGRVNVVEGRVPDKADTTLVFSTEQDLIDYQTADSDDVCRMILASRIRIEGNQALYGYFGYLLSLLTLEDDVEATRAQIAKHRLDKQALAEKAGTPDRKIRKERLVGRLPCGERDAGVKWLDDARLPEYGLSDFPRLVQFKKDHHNTPPEITAEQGVLLTDFYTEHGFETKNDGTPWDPNLRMANGYFHLMENKKAVIRPGDLIAGTMTPNPICGSVTQPYTIGWSIWAELRTIHARELDPYVISEETIETLHKYVFPFWVNRHIHQYWIDEYDNPMPAQIADRLFCLNLWGLISLNPGCPGFEKAVKIGLNGLRQEIESELRIDPDADEEKKNTLEAMKISLDGVSAYARHLAEQAGIEAGREENFARKRELQQIQQTLLNVPDKPAETLGEAVQTIWIMFVAIGLESMDDDVAIGRMDQILQPYFEADMSKKTSRQDREAYIKYAIEIVGCLFMRVTSHRIGAPTIASWQNSGAPPTSTTIVGGVTPDGKDAVNDMSYVVLKVAEMLSLNNPNMHARYMPGINSEAYLKRLCEVNYITCGTPGIHNDAAVIESLSQHDGWEMEDIRDWTPTGCVEPVISGKHLACTGDIDSNLMAPFTMALNNGYHPIPKWNFGPKTGEVEVFETFEGFYKAFQTQFEFIYEHALVGSKQLLKIHQKLLPSPLYSTLLEGCVASGRGMTRGGAKYNSSGASLIALADVIDSLMVIKTLVFDEKVVSFRELKEATDSDFEGYARILARAQNVPKFGSGNADANELANRVTHMVADFLHGQDNGRGGTYLTGYRSNNNHTVYGRTSGASPSGRRAYTPFTPGLTPNPAASKNIQDNLLDVAQLDPKTMDNNIAFNVRLAFSKANSYEQNINSVADIVKTYFGQGGMQIQFIMVDTDTLIDAMAYPELYPDVVVRVSGYTGYYIEMQRDLQLEIIGRSEFAL